MEVSKAWAVSKVWERSQGYGVSEVWGLKGMGVWEISKVGVGVIWPYLDILQLYFEWIESEVHKDARSY